VFQHFVLKENVIQESLKTLNMGRAELLHKEGKQDEGYRAIQSLKKCLAYR
jgi:hypothetical protein